MPDPAFAPGLALGYAAAYSPTNGNYNIHIGHSGFAPDNNLIRIGNGQSYAYIAGIYGATVSGGSAVYVNSSGQLGTVTSSRRFKQDIEDAFDAGH